MALDDVTLTVKEGEFVSIVKTVKQEKAIEILNRVILYMLSDAVARVREYYVDEDD